MQHLSIANIQIVNTPTTKLCYHGVMEGIHERLRKSRERAGLTQGQVAEYESISKSYISKLENGANIPNVWPLLAQLARRYKTSADYILGLTNEPFLPKSEAPPRYQEFIRLLDELGEAERWQVLQMARLMSGRLDELLVSVLDAFLQEQQAEVIAEHSPADMDYVLRISEAVTLGDIASMFRVLRARGFRQEYLSQELEQVYRE